MKTKALAVSAAALALAACGAEAAEDASALSILKSYAADYVTDPNLTEPMTFGVKIADDFYTVDVAPAGEDGKGRAKVRAGAPQKPTFYFTLESNDYLRKLDRGEYAALTLMAKAFSTDVTPMDVEMMEGFEPGEGFGDKLVPMIFHFWTRGKPEIINFSPEATRVAHGTNVGIFYYQSGFRSGWFEIRPGQHVNADPKSRTNPFASLFIITKGEVTARIDGVDRPFREGEAMLVPAGASHEFLNDGTQPAFGFLFMFGEGA